MWNRKPQKLEMSIQKQRPVKIQLRNPQIVTVLPTGLPTLPQRQAYFLQLKQADQAGVLWSRQFVKRSPRQKGITLKFPEQAFTLSNQVSSFPDIVWLASTGFVGYYDNSGNQTERVIGFSLSYITSTNYNGVMTYNAVYKNSQVQTWDLPSNSILSFKVLIDSQTSAYGNLDQQINIKMDVYYRSA